MATAPKIAPVESVLQIDINDIAVVERVGILWPDKAVALGQLMAANGQRTPINIRANGPKAAKPWTLVAGWHRLEGAKLAQLRTIDAIQVYGDYREIEAEENLHRRNLGPIERACFVRAVADAAEARLKDQHGNLSPEQIKARARWDQDRAKAPGVVREDVLADGDAENAVANFAAAYQWQESTAQAIGMSKRTVRDDLALHRAIVAPFPDLYEALARHPIVGENASALCEIASYVVDARRDIIEALIETPDMTLAQALEGLALKAAKAAAPTGATKHMNNAGANIAKLSAEQQKSWAPAFAAAIKPSALEAMRDAINAKLAEIQTHREGVAVELEAHFRGDLTPAAPVAPVEEKPVPAVAIRASVKPDYLVCLDCGEHQKMLKRHLMSHHQLTPDAYLTRWQLPRDYPMVAPNYAEERRQLAKKIGLGTKGGDA